MRSLISLTLLMIVAALVACSPGTGGGSSGGGGASGNTPSGAAMRVFVGSTSGTELADAQQNVAELDFGDHTLGDPLPAPITIVISSEGTSDLVIDTPRLIDPLNSFVVDASGLVSPLAPGQTTSFTVSFDPPIDGPAFAIAGFSHNADNTTDRAWSAFFTGNALAAQGGGGGGGNGGGGGGGGGNPTPAELEVEVEGFSVVHGESGTTPLTYAEIDLSSATLSADKAINVRNIGGQDCELSSATLSGADASHFTLQVAQGATLPITLAPNQSVDFTLTYAPQSASGPNGHVVQMQFAHTIPSPYPSPRRIHPRGARPSTPAPSPVAATKVAVPWPDAAKRWWCWPMACPC